MIEKIYTIGVYDTTHETFFGALQKHKIDLFCDIRQRRGVRGSKYTYANSQGLQTALEGYEIAYLHYKSLAPTKEIREAQYAIDDENKVGKRNRSILSKTFIDAYHNQILSQFDSDAFLSEIANYKRICLFCVECLPVACHRSLVSQHLADILNIPVEHLTPCHMQESS